MMIRDGFVTNSSSTNFLIISQEELTVEYLTKKLGIKSNSPIEFDVENMCREIIDGTKGGVCWFDVKELNYESILEVFGHKSAARYKELTGKGYHAYIGHTESADSPLTAFFTQDCFILDEKGFYIDGKNCIW